MNRPTNAGVNADAPASPKANRGALRREAPTGIEPVNSGFAGQYDAPAIDRDGPATQENDDSGTAMPSRVGGMDGARMPAGMPGVADDLRALEPPTSEAGALDEAYRQQLHHAAEEATLAAMGDDPVSRCAAICDAIERNQLPGHRGFFLVSDVRSLLALATPTAALAALTREAQARGEYDAWDALPPVMQRALELFGAEAYEAGQADALAGRDVEAPNIPDDADFAVGFGSRGRALIALLAAPVRDAAGTGTDGVTDEELRRALLVANERIGMAPDVAAYMADQRVADGSGEWVRAVITADRAARAGARP